jgi:hypothetical protein
MIAAAAIVAGIAVGFAFAWWWPWTQRCMYFCNGTRLQAICLYGGASAATCLRKLESQCGPSKPIS